MNRVIFFVMSLMAMLSVGCNGDTPAPEPTPQPEPQEEFEVEITKTTRSTVTFSVTPRNLDMEYLCVVYDKDTADEFTRDEFLVESILQEIADEASNSGKTLTEYMPEVVDKGVIEEASFSGLSTNTEHYIILFGVENNDGYSASTEITKVAFTTATVEKVECEFDVETTVVDNSVTLAVTPSNSEISWYLCTMPKDTYNYYVEDENGYNMSHSYFYEYYFQQDINAYLQQGNTAEQVVEALIHSGSVELQAKGLKENTDYYYLIAGLILDEEGIVICTDVARGEYRTEGAAQSEMTFEIKVWDIGQMEASFSITPSNNKDKYCALVAPWDGVTEAQDMMHKIVNQWGGWMEAMANDRGPVEHSGATAMKLPAADTDYYIIAFGYDGGITTEATMATFRTLPGGSVEDVVFEVTASNITPYGFMMNVKSSDATIYYVPGLCASDEYDEATYVGYENDAFQYYFEEYKKFNPAITVAELLDQYYYNGNATLEVSGLQPDTEYIGYIYALDVHSGEVVKCFTFPAFAHTSTFSTITPTIELVGYFSGDDENGTIFNNAAATKGRAITVVKYGNLEDVRSLFTTMLEGDCSNAATYSDGELWQLASGYWKKGSLSAPYDFYLADWNVVQTALCYATDNNGQLSAIKRLYTCPTAENKSDIAILKKITDALNTRSSASSLLLPESVVIGNTLPSRPVIKPIE
ncbi:MAG: hypothetical protein UHN93_00650 [Alistipes sp.]|nr:hypothetical protein [Alistipes sp.]